MRGWTKTILIRHDGEPMSPTQEDRPDGEPPLWSIGLAVSLMLGVPMVLYWIAPPGPLREGDTVFSGRPTKVLLAHPLRYETKHFNGTCLLDAEDPLMVVQRPSERADGLILAKIQGKTTFEWPFCPPQAEVLLAHHQIAQESGALSDMKKSLMKWWNP